MDAVQRGFSFPSFDDPSGAPARYGLFIPRAYDGSHAFPLILFLHGAGECGKDGERPVHVGIGPTIRRQEDTFPFITLFPQSQRGGWRPGFPEANRALAILDYVQFHLRVDPRRVHLTGISMGGYGTWNLAVRHPDRWASIVPVCGGGDPSKAYLIKDVPCWCFHGEADEIIPVEESRDMIRALRKAGGNPRYTEFPGVPHNSWDPAYATPELFEWMAECRLNQGR